MANGDQQNDCCSSTVGAGALCDTSSPTVGIQPTASGDNASIFASSIVGPSPKGDEQHPSSSSGQFSFWVSIGGLFGF